MDTGQRCVGCLWMRRKRNFKQGPLPTTYKNLGDVFVLILSVKHEDKQAVQLLLKNLELSDQFG